MAGIPEMKNLRSFSLAGISSIVMNFNDDSNNGWNRERVLERLNSVTLPAGLTPQLQTHWSQVGQIYWCAIESKNPNFDVMEQKLLEDWTLEKTVQKRSWHRGCSQLWRLNQGISNSVAPRQAGCLRSEHCAGRAATRQ